MDSSKNGRWIIPFKKFGRLRVLNFHKFYIYMYMYFFQLEWLMNITIRDIILYIFYLAVVCIVVHGHRDIKEAYYNSLAIEDVLINPGCIVLSQCFFLDSVRLISYLYVTFSSSVSRKKLNYCDR